MGRLAGRRQRVDAQRRVRTTALALVIAAVCAIGGGYGLVVRRIRLVRLDSQSSQTTYPKPSGPGYSVPPAAEPLNRIVYRYSVIPGGVGSAEELRRRAAADGAVAEHYRKFQYGAGRMIRLNADRRAYVSYRNKDGIFWTRRKVLLKKGELLLTDGHTLIRTRCGNQVCETQQTPVASVPEPSERAFETPIPEASPIPGLTLEPFAAELPSLTPGEAASSLPLETVVPDGHSPHAAGIGAGGGAIGPVATLPPGRNPGAIAVPVVTAPVAPGNGNSTLPENSPPVGAPVPEAGGELVLLPGNQLTAPGSRIPAVPGAEVIVIPPSQPPPSGTGGGGTPPGSNIPPQTGELEVPQPSEVLPGEDTGQPGGPGGGGGGGGGNRPIADVVVPEPSTLVLVSLGALLAGLRPWVTARQRRRSPGEPRLH